MKSPFVATGVLTKVLSFLQKNGVFSGCTFQWHSGMKCSNRKSSGFPVPNSYLVEWNGPQPKALSFCVPLFETDLLIGQAGAG